VSDEASTKSDREAAVTDAVEEAVKTIITTVHGYAAREAARTVAERFGWVVEAPTDGEVLARCFTCGISDARTRLGAALCHDCFGRKEPPPGRESVFCPTCTDTRRRLDAALNEPVLRGVVSFSLDGSALLECGHEVRGR